VLAETLSRVDEALAARQPGRALELLETVQSAAPQAALFPAARAFLQLGAVQAGLAKLEEAVEVLPDHVEARLALALVLRDVDRTEDAARVLRESVERFPDDSRAAEQLSLVLLSQGLAEEALAVAESALARGLESPLLRLAAGAAAGKSVGKREEGIAHLERALALGPPDPGRTHLELGVLLAESGRHNDAVPYLGEAARLLPESADAQFRLATSLRALGRTEEAVTALQRFQDLSSAQQAAEDRARAAGIALNEAQELALANRLDEAALRVRKILADFPGHPQTMLLLAKIYASQGRFSEAAELLEGARTALAGDVELHLLEGLVKRRLGDVAGAAGALRTALRLDPGLGEAHAVLGGIYLEQGDSAAALAEFEQALENGVDGHQMRLAYSRALASEGYVVESREQRQLADELAADASTAPAAATPGRPESPEEPPP
jgi:tetratricopeptide (TPR) repeat protein